MFDPIIELHMKLQKNREEVAATREYNNDPMKYKLRMASVAAMERDMERKKELERNIKERDTIHLLDLGCDYNEISSVLRLSISEISRIARDNEDTKRFLRTGRISKSDGGYICITPGLPTPR
jgi:hypothetical protein